MVTALVVLEANWNRPMLVVAMICFTVICCVMFIHMPKWFK